MKKYLVFGLLIAVSLILVGIAMAAKPEFLAADVSNPVTGEVKNTITIPAKAVEVAPNIFYLGMAVEGGKLVQGYAFVDYKKGFGKPAADCGNGICEPGENINKCPQDCGGGEDPNPDPEPDTSDCYGFLAKGAKWKEIEPYIVDPTNTRGLDQTFVRSDIGSDILKWEDAAGKNILGQEEPGIVDGADMISPDNKNEVYFADIDRPDAIGITVIWGIFGGPPPFRQLVEWDQVYDDVDFDWSATGESGKMDFENIATHELGHSVGMGDLYDTECSEQTMYGYASNGEINKRSLEAGDIAGVRELYR